VFFLHGQSRERVKLITYTSARLRTCDRDFAFTSPIHSILSCLRRFISVASPLFSAKCITRQNPSLFLQLISGPKITLIGIIQ
jgi:hypothetical protein